MLISIEEGSVGEIGGLEATAFGVVS
jgi:hypothetical protein